MFLSVGVGDNHAVILLADGKVYSFGCNDQGQLGRGHEKPLTRAGLTSYIHIQGNKILLKFINIMFLPYFSVQNKLMDLKLTILYRLFVGHITPWHLTNGVRFLHGDPIHMGSLGSIFLIKSASLLK